MASCSLGLLHNLGDGRRHTARAFAPWRSHRRGEIFMMAISRHGDTHRHLATRINLWRHPSPYGDTFPIWRQASQRRDSRENLITFCIQLVPMLSKRWLPRCYLCCSVAHWWSSSPFRDMCRPSAICVAVPQQLSRLRNSSSFAMQAIAAHLAVPRPSRNCDFGHDSRRQGCATGPLVVTPARASSRGEHGWRSHLLSEVTLAWQGAVTVNSCHNSGST